MATLLDYWDPYWRRIPRIPYFQLHVPLLQVVTDQPERSVLAYYNCPPCKGTLYIQGVPGGMCQTSGGYSLC
jgi:hypothetical protein